VQIGRNGAGNRRVRVAGSSAPEYNKHILCSEHQMKLFKDLCKGVHHVKCGDYTALAQGRCIM